MISEKLQELDEQLGKMASLAGDFQKELASPNPEVTMNGTVIASGYDARDLLDQMLSLHKVVEEMASDARKSFGH